MKFFQQTVTIKAEPTQPQYAPASLTPLIRMFYTNRIPQLAPEFPFLDVLKFEVKDIQSTASETIVQITLTVQSPDTLTFDRFMKNFVKLETTTSFRVTSHNYIGA